jgi:hypothetical protein
MLFLVAGAGGCLSRLMLRLMSVIALIAFALPSAAQVPQTLTREQALQIQRDCSTIESCVAAMRTETAINFSAILEQKFSAFGEAAVEPLMRVLTDDPEPRMRLYAGLALDRMQRIDARYLPTLIAEDRKGNPMRNWEGEPPDGWLATPIGLVRDNPEALAYLFDVAERHGVRARSNRVEPGIMRSSRAAWLAEVRRRLEGFRPEQDPQFLSFLAELARFGGWPRPDPNAPPEWLEPALVRIAADDSMRAQATAAYYLRQSRHPLALEALLRGAREHFAAIPVWDGHTRILRMPGEDGEMEWSVLSDSYIEREIEEIGLFGEMAREAAPMLRPFLARRDAPDSRAAVALALGLIGDRESIPALIDAANDRDDWLLAYNAVEALGRLRAEEARVVLRRLSAEHWTVGVRNNAERALNMLNGGAFERPGDAEADARGRVRDGPATEREEDEFEYIGPLRRRADRIHPRAQCLFALEARQQHLSQAPVAGVRFPRSDANVLAARAVPEDSKPTFSADVRAQMRSGAITMVQDLPRGALVGTYAGEWIGALHYISDRDGQVTQLIDDNVSLSFRHGDKLYVVTGLSHMLSTRGAVWEIDTRGRAPRVVRRIRLATQAERVFATARGDIAFVSWGGTILLGEDGVLRDGGDDETCRAP